MNDRAFHIYTARVLLAQVPVFRGRRVDRFHLLLLEWAAKARRAAAATPIQRDLFGRAA